MLVLRVCRPCVLRLAGRIGIEPAEIEVLGTLKSAGNPSNQRC